ncbi:13152_t:CDS:2, partial [Rhizophagus irregularis]
KSKVSPGKFEAECKYCSKTWKRGEVPILEEHLASHCSNVPRLVLREYIQKVGARENISNKKRKLDKSTTGQTTITAFHDSSDLPEARTNRINRALVKFFVCCGISYKIVEHLLFLDLLKELNAGYDPPTREYLSGCLLETELCVINDKIEEDIMNQQNLTLDIKNNSKLGDIELNQRISEALAESDDADEDDSEFEDNSHVENSLRRTINDLKDDLFNNTKGKDEDENTLTDDNNNDTIGKGILDYNVNDLFDEYVNE